MRLRTVLFLISMPLWAQWTKVPLETIPRTADGKPNLSAPAPRLPDGKPDLSGVWMEWTNFTCCKMHYVLPCLRAIGRLFRW